MSHTYQDLQDMWWEMLKAQRAKGDFDLTIRELVGIFGVNSTSVVQYRLKMMVDVGLVRKQNGRYRAIPESEVKVIIQH